MSPAEMAENFYLPVAEQGEPYAQLTLGEMYRDGVGVAQDLVQAYAWLSASAAQGVEEAAPLRDETWARLSPEQQRGARELAEQYARAYRLEHP
jgi:TPR repeat protein